MLTLGMTSEREIGEQPLSAQGMAAVDEALCVEK